MGSRFFFSLDAIKSKKNETAGTLTCVTSKEVPGFVNISFNALRLKETGFQEAIWHPNANKIGYCQQGNAGVSIRTPSSLEKFAIGKGDIFFIPKGSIYSILNLGNEETIINFALDSATPEIMRLSKALESLSDDVFTATFATPSGFIKDLQKSKNSAELIKNFSYQKISHAKPDPVPFSHTNRYKFNIEESNQSFVTKGGYLQWGTKTNLPVLEGLGILGFGLNPKGVVEPHWHTNAGELVYIVKGYTRITILSPNGKIEDLEVSAGQGAFAPASHFHNIENIGDEDAQVIAFFNHAEPDYIGLGEVLGAYSNEMLACLFNVPPDYFDKLKRPSGPLVIVPV
jgi:oxalate decarboxylase